MGKNYPAADFVCPECLTTEERKLGEQSYFCSICGSKMNRRWSAPAVIIH